MLSFGINLGDHHVVVSRVLCVDDDPLIRDAVRRLLEPKLYEFAGAASGAEALAILAAENIDVVISDHSMPSMTGLELLSRMSELHPKIPFIMLTGQATLDDAVSAMKGGASDFISKPVDAARLSASLKNAIRLRDKDSAIDRLQLEVRDVHSVDGILGRSELMEDVRKLVQKTAHSDVAVLILGETGTGKELVARALHYGGPRAERPFVDVNSSVATESLLDSELFGHEKGSFTGAAGRRRGQFEQADGGTLFLDEIGDMPLSTQAKILRTLQEHTIRRVGSEDAVGVDVRVVCATHRDLESAIKAGTFRQDLYYRISTLVIELPPLRARPEDLPELVEHFALRACRREGRRPLSVSSGALECLQAYSWPGNVRELQHAVDRAVLLADKDQIQEDDLPFAVRRRKETETETEPRAEAGLGLIEAVDRLERSMIQAALLKNDGVKARAARELRVSERRLSYKMMNLGIETAKDT